MTWLIITTSCGDLTLSNCPAYCMELAEPSSAAIEPFQPELLVGLIRLGKEKP